MANEQQHPGAAFNGVNQREGMQEESRKEHEKAPGAFSDRDELPPDDSIRNQAEVSGSPFGMESSTARFSNTGVKNQTRKDENTANIEDVNQADHERGSGGTLYSDYLNHAQHEFISGTGEYTEDSRRQNEQSDDSIRPFDAMQGHRDRGSGGRSEAYKGYDPSGEKRPNE